MESNNWKTTQTQPDQHPNNNVEAGDWKSNFSSESRSHVINKILDILKKEYPYPSQASELNKVALNFEEKVYSIATSQGDYLRRISVKLSKLDNKNQNAGAGSLATIPASSSRIALDREFFTIMESNNWTTTQTQPDQHPNNNVEAGDWKSHIF